MRLRCIVTAGFAARRAAPAGNGNHAHSVFRDTPSDFGMRLLDEHYHKSHARAE